MQENKKQLGEVLREYREHSFPNEGLRRVAKQIDIDYTHLFRIEDGQYVPQDDTLTRILDAYSVSLDQRFYAFTIARMTPAQTRVMRTFMQSHDPKLATAMFRRPKPNKNHEKR